MRTRQKSSSSKYRFKWHFPLVSIMGVVAVYYLIWTGPSNPIRLPEGMMQATDFPEVVLWVIILYIYCAIASLLPMWMLLQPCDYINGLQLFIGLGALYLSILIVHPNGCGTYV